MQECELKIVSNLERLPIEHNLICDAVYLRELILICLEKVACHAMINGAPAASSHGICLVICSGNGLWTWGQWEQLVAFNCLDTSSSTCKVMQYTWVCR